MVVSEEDRLRFQREGFLHLREVFEPDEARTYFAELDRLLHVTCLRPDAAHWVPATDELTPTAALLLSDDRFAETAEQLLGRPVVGEGTDGSYYAGDTGWHDDAFPGSPAVKFTLYAEPLVERAGALQVLPGSHDPELPDGEPRAIETEPGDAVVLDVRIKHASFGGARRLAGSFNFRADPTTPDEERALRDYFAKSHEHVRRAYPNLELFGEHWRAIDRPRHQQWLARLTQLDLLDPRQGRS